MASEAGSHPPVADRHGRCVVCEARAVIHYDARFDAEVCDVCDAMLTIRDEEFRRAYPAHDAAIRAIWRERGDPSRAREIGLRYYEMGYWDDRHELNGISGPADGDESDRVHDDFDWPEESA